MMNSNRGNERARLRVLPAGLLLALSLVLFPSAGHDDSHITFWAAHSLADLGQVVNYNGERIEQSSSLLHVLVLAGLVRILPLSLPTIGSLLSILCGLLTLGFTHALARRFVPGWLAVAAGAVVASSAYFAFWTTGAMETTLAALTTTALLVSSIRFLEDRRRTWPGAGFWICGGAYLLARPEAVVVIGTSLVACLCVSLVPGLMADPSAARPRFARLLGAIAWLALGIFAARYAYFGQLFPQPVSAKASGLSVSKLVLGANFLLYWLSQPPLVCVSLLTLAGAASLPARLRRGFRPPAAGVLVVLVLLAHSAFVVTTGGDYMVGARFFVPVIPLAVVMAMVALASLVRTEQVRALVAAILLIQIWGVVSFAQQSSTGFPLWKALGPDPRVATEGFSWFERANRLHLRDIPVAVHLESVIARLRSRGGTAPIRILSGQMGLVPYHVARLHFGAVRFVDRWGIATPEFMRCALTRALPARWDGRWVVPYAFYFEHATRIEAECGIPRPDVVFEVTDPRWPEAELEGLLARNGYTVVYRQEGRVESGSRIRGLPVWADQIIAVRDELAAGMELETLSFDADPDQRM